MHATEAFAPWRDFEAAHPRLLGALLDAVVATLATLPGTQLDGLPRMADFGRWGEAGSRARGGAPGAFLDAYEKNRAEATEIALESSPVASAVRVLMAGHSPWTGTAADLLGDLGNLVEPGLRRSAIWPKSPRGLAGALKRVMAGLRAVGIAVGFDRKGKQGTRKVTLTKVAPKG